MCPACFYACAPPSLCHIVSAEKGEVDTGLRQSGKLIAIHARDHKVLSLQVIVKEHLGWVRSSEHAHKVREHRRINPVVIHLEVKMDSFASVLKIQICHASFKIDVIPYASEDKCTLREFGKPFCNPSVRAFVFNALRVDMPRVDAVISPRRALLRHAKSHQGHGIAGLLVLLARPGLKQILHGKGRRKTEA